MILLIFARVIELRKDHLKYQVVLIWDGRVRLWNCRLLVRIIYSALGCPCAKDLRTADVTRKDINGDERPLSLARANGQRKG